MERVFDRGFAGEELDRLNAEGLELARMLAEELGTGFQVEYFDEIARDFVWVVRAD